MVVVVVVVVVLMMMMMLMMTVVSKLPLSSRYSGKKDKIWCVWVSFRVGVGCVPDQRMVRSREEGVEENCLDGVGTPLTHTVLYRWSSTYVGRR